MKIKFFLIILLITVTLLNCNFNNVTVNPDFVAIPFPQNKVVENFPEYANKVYTPGIYSFPLYFFNEIQHTGISIELIQYQIDDNIVISYMNNDPRDNSDHRVKFKDGTALAIDFKTTWELKQDIETKQIDIKTLLNVLNKLKPENRNYLTKDMFSEYAADITTNTIRSKFKTILNYFEFSEKYYSTIGDIVKTEINSKLSEECPIQIKSCLVSNDAPEEITKSAMIIKSAIERDIDLIKEIGPFLKQYPEAVPYLQLKFAENNTSKIGTFIFGSSGIVK